LKACYECFLLLDNSDSHHLLYSYSPLSCAKRVQEQQKKDRCIKSLNTIQDHLQMKFCVEQDTLDTLKGCLHDKKSKHCKVMIDEESTCKRLEDEIQELNEWIFELDEERKVAEANGRVVKEKYIAAVRVDQTRLHKWGQEQDKQRDAQDKIAEEAKVAKKQHKMYAQLLVLEELMYVKRVGR
jgi:hypothetical protein